MNPLRPLPALNLRHSLKRFRNVAATFAIVGVLATVFVWRHAFAASILWSSTSGSAWLTGGNWTGGAVPGALDVAQFGANPTGSSGVGINMNGSTNNGANNQVVGAIELTSARVANHLIGNSSLTTGGTLTLNGAAVNAIPFVIIRNGSGNLLTIQNTQSTGNQTMGVALGGASDNIINIDSTGGVTISSIISGASKKLTLSGTGTGTLTLGGVNTYSGDTTISTGTLAITGTGSIANSPNIVIAGGANFDLKTITPSNYTLASGQGLKATGTATSGQLSLGKDLILASNSPLQFTAFNGTTAPLAMQGTAPNGNLVLSASNPVTVTTTTQLGAGNYTLISKGLSSGVSGTAPTSVTVNGSGIAPGTFATLSITGSQLVLKVITTPSSITVNNTGDGSDASAGNGICETATGNGICTLRAAIQEANAIPASAGTINIGFSVNGTITPATSALPLITHDVNITGPGANLLTVNGSNLAAVFDIPNANTVGMSGITITGGNGTSLVAGGINNSGSLTLNGVAITGNNGKQAGGIENFGAVLTVNNSTISGNTATLPSGCNNGGGIADSNNGAHTINITNTTISGNSANSAGGACNNDGAIMMFGGGTMTITGSTITNNTSGNSTSAAVNRNTGTVVVRDTIIAGNVGNASIPDVAGAFTSSGFNLIGNVGAATGFTQLTDQTGNSTPLDPKLNALGSNGGPTQTHSMQAGSPAIDKGSAFGSPADQRGSTRPFNNLFVLPAAGGDDSDIGAYEEQTSLVAGPLKYRSKTSGNWNASSTWEASADGGTWVNAASTPTSTDDTITIQGTHTVTITANVNADQLTVNSGGLLLVNSGITFTVDDGTGTDLTIASPNGLVGTAGQITNNGQAQVNGTLRIDQGGFVGGTGTFAYDQTTGTLAFNNTSGTFGVNNFNFWPTSNAPQNVSVASGGITMNVARTVGLSFVTSGRVQGADNLTFNGLFNIFAGGSVSGSPTYGASSTLQYSTGGLYGRAGEWLAVTSGAGYPANVQVSNNTTLDFSNGGTFNNAPSQMAGNLTIDSGSTLQMASATPMTQPLIVIGNITNNGTLTLSTSAGGDLHLQGNLSNGGTFTTNNRPVFFEAGNQQNVSDGVHISGGAFTLTVPYVRVNKTGGTVRMLTALTALAPAGGNSVQFANATSTITLNGQRLTLGGTIGAAPAGAGLVGDPLGSELSLQDGGTAGALGTVSFVSGSQQVTTLTINRTGANGSVAFDSPLLVNAALNLTNGIVGMGANTLTVGSSGTVTRNTGYIVGAEQKNFINTTSFTFDVGTLNGYTPVDANSTTATGTGSLSVRPAQTKQPNVAGANALARYWTLSGSNITTNLTFHYLAGDVAGTEANYKIFKYSGATFTQFTPTNLNTTSHTATLNGVSSFSDWTLAESASVFGQLQFAQANTNDAETNSGSHVVNIAVQRTGGASGAVSVNYAVTDGTATTADNDYSASPATGTLNWADGDDADKTIAVNVNGDTTVEPDETVNLTLSAPAGGASLGTPSAATLTITNDDVALPNTVYVDDDFTGPVGSDPDGAGGPATSIGFDAFPTIQGGLDGVASGGTVNVAAGNYNEQPVTGKSLHLVGAGAATVNVNPTGALAPRFSNFKIVFEVNNGANVEISGVTIKGPLTLGGCATGLLRRFYGVYVRSGATLNLHDSSVLDIRENSPAPGTNCTTGTAIDVGSNVTSPHQTGTLTVNNVTINGFQARAVTVDSTGTTGTITNSTLTGSTSTNTGQTVVLVALGASANISGNQITGAQCSDAVNCGSDTFNQSAAVGVSLTAPANGTQVANNTISGNDYGINYVAAPGVTATFSGNTFNANRYFGVNVSEGNAAITGNTFSGASNVAVVAASVNDPTNNTQSDSSATLTGNTITGATVALQLLDQSGFSADGFFPRLTAHFNRIVAATAIDNPQSSVSDMENNWWGCNAGPGNAGCGAVTGTGADFNPWLVLAASASPNSIIPGGSSTVSADMTHNSDNVVPASAPPDMPVSFGATNGMMSPTSGTLAAGAAGSTFTSANASNAVATATVDNQNANAPITVNAPSFSINDVSHNEGDSGTTSFTFTVTKTGATAFGASVDYATADGTATAPSDYTALPPTTLNFGSNETTKQITVLVNGDTSVEPNEAFTVHLSNAVNASIADADGTGTITNDDTAANTNPTISDIGDQTITEDNSTGAIPFTVGDAEQSAASLSVSGSSSNQTLVPDANITFGGAGANRTVTVTPAAGQTGTATITVTVDDGQGGTASDTFLLTVNAAVCTTAPAGMVSWYSADGNADDIYGTNNGALHNGATFAPGKVSQAFSFDGADDYVEVPDANDLNSTTATWDFWVKTTQTGGPYGLVGKHDQTSSFNGVTVEMSGGIVGLQVKAGSGGSAIGGTTPVNDGRFHHVAVTFQSGGSENLYIDGQLEATGAAPTFSFGSNPLRLGRLLDSFWGAFGGQLDEVEIFNRALSQTEIADIYNAGSAGKCHASTLQLSGATYAVSEANPQATITVTRTGAHDTAASVNYATVAGGTATGGASCSAGVDYQDASGTLNFAAGETSETFVVPVCEDTAAEGDETVKLQLSNASGATLGSQADATLTITDNDATVQLSGATYSVGEAGGHVTITVTRAGSASGQVTVKLNTSDGTAAAGSDYAAATDQLITFNDGDTADKTFDIAVNDDSLYEGSETFGVALSNPTGASLGSPASAVVTITDNETPPSFAVNDVFVARPQSGTSTAKFTVTLSGPAQAPASVHYATSDGTASAGSDYDAASGTLNFASGETVKTVSVSVNAGGSGSKTFTLNLSSPNAPFTSSDASGTGTIVDPVLNGQVIISEFRVRGAAGARDEFVELYNNTNSPVTVAADDGTPGWSLATLLADGTTVQIVATLPAGTVIQPRAHYLVAGVPAASPATGYSLGVAPSLTYDADIPDGTGVGLFRTNAPANITSATQLDAAGFNNLATPTAALFREGAGLASPGANDGEYGFVRSLVTGLPKDTGDNASDFLFVSTDGGTYGGARSALGAPGPENRLSPLNRGATVKAKLVDSTQPSSAPPNRLRDGTAVPNGPAGTITFRRRFTNSTGTNVTRLRFRVVDVTTLNTPNPGGAQADLRLLTSATVTQSNVGDATTCSAAGAGAPPCTVTVEGLTLETPPSQGAGGGYNSTVAAGTITPAAPLAPNASVNVQFTLGVEQTGGFRFFVIVEAALDSDPTSSPAADAPAKHGAQKAAPAKQSKAGGGPLKMN
jgi:CSLREA domain-containing protein